MSRCTQIGEGHANLDGLLKPEIGSKIQGAFVKYSNGSTEYSKLVAAEFTKCAEGAGILLE